MYTYIHIYNIYQRNSNIIKILRPNRTKEKDENYQGSVLCHICIAFIFLLFLTLYHDFSRDPILYIFHNNILYFPRRMNRSSTQPRPVPDS